MKKIFQKTRLFIFVVLLLAFVAALSAQAVPSVPSSQAVTPHLIAAVGPVRSGDPFYIYVLFDLQEGWHVYWRHPGDAGFPPSIKWDLPPGWSAGELEFSLPQKLSEPGGMVVYGYEKKALLRALITPADNLEQNSSWNIKAHLSWLACSTLCVPGSAILSANVSDKASATIPGEALVLKKEFLSDASFRWVQPSSGAVSSTKETLSLWALLLALASGMLGGFILNLMPCVLPVISLKIFGFISQAGESRSKILRHGLAFVGGIYLWFIMLGLVMVALKAAGMQVTWAFQFQSPLFLLLLSILVFLFALNLFGVFEVTLPNRAGSQLDAISAQSGYKGSFFQGLFATLLATPCTAPFLGSALGFAFTQSGTVIMAMFVAIATGMAFPYFLLSAQPAWMKCLPRPGMWMERVKQFMGFPLLATNLWLLSVLGVMRGVGEVVMMLVLLLLLGLSAWIYGAAVTLQSSMRRVAVSLSLLIFSFSCWYFIPKIVMVSEPSSHHLAESKPYAVRDNKISWVPYSAARLKELRDAGKPVFLDFTAAWCLTCQFNERTAINTTPVREMLEKKGIVPMKADWTSANPEITEVLKSFGRVGVPFYVFYPGDRMGEKREPITFSELLTESQLLKAFSKL